MVADKRKAVSREGSYFDPSPPIHGPPFVIQISNSSFADTSEYPQRTLMRNHLMFIASVKERVLFVCPNHTPFLSII